MIRSLIVEGFAVIGFCFTGFSVGIYLVLRFGGRMPMTKKMRAEWQQLEALEESDPTMKTKDEYAAHCLLLMWLFIGLAVFGWILSRALNFGWKVLFG